MNTNSQEALLLFADISGFTSYIRQNPWTEAHALDAIHKLLDAVIDRLEPAFTLAKLEGDAAFCHLELSGETPDSRQMTQMLEAAFTAFSDCQSALVSRNHCHCLACRGLASLQLKIILHRGQIAFLPTRLGREPGGLPVIVLHRLSKNRVRGNRYLMWTAPVDALLRIEAPVSSHMEDCQGIGKVKVFVTTSLPGKLQNRNRGPLDWLADFISKSQLWLPLRFKRTPGRSGAFRLEQSTPPTTSGMHCPLDNR